MNAYFLGVFAVFPTLAVALQPISDVDLQQVSGQAGLTIETTINNPDDPGTFVTTGAIRFTENDLDGEGEEYFETESLKIQMVELDGSGNVIGPGDFTTTIDVLADGTLSLKTTDISALNISLGAVNFSGRTVGQVDINKWKFGSGSFLETGVVPDASTVKLRMRTLMTAGSELDFRYTEDNLTLATDVKFESTSSGEAFESEFFLSAVDNELRLEFGKTVGTLELNNLRLLDDGGNNLFGNRSFGDVGFGDVTVNDGYFSLKTNPDGEGLAGSFSLDQTIGNLFYRTNGNRLAVRNFNLNTNGLANYTFELSGSNTDYARGFTTTISGLTNLDLTFSSIGFEDGDGTNPTPSIGSYALKNFSQLGTTMTIDVLALSGAGNEGLQVNTEIPKAKFDVTICDKPSRCSDSDPKITAATEITNLSISNKFDLTEKGLHISIDDLSVSSIDISSIKLGDNQTYQGQTGRVVVSDLTLAPGSYMRAEPISIP
ncbi:MAG: hypothetical protein MK185_07495 [Saccharospirillaceae bacterium]|jgi:hypothetical protein|nr:hypothetical protein A3759_13255 [Thalassolituus sp. HI0120]MCH2040460.1 hypothetical protein [Saccharospirillaceae bacterium]